MKVRRLLIFLFLGLAAFFCRGNNDLPVAISPGTDEGVAVVETRCPTFSWAGVAWAEKYRVAVFISEEEETKTYEEMSVTGPVLTKMISGSALSWTPSLDHGLIRGIEYIWYIGAMDEGENCLWSEGRRFRVEMDTNITLIEEVRSGLRQEGVKDEVIDKVLTGINSSLIGGKPKDSRGNNPISPLGSEGAYSTFYGTGAGFNNSSDSNSNSFFGANTGYTNSTGYNNSFVGCAAGNANTGGYANTFLGYAAGYLNTTGNANTFSGNNSGRNNTTGSSNTFIGYVAGTASTTSSANTFIGSEAGMSNTTGYDNTFIGYDSGYTNTTGNFNTFLGREAGKSNTTAMENTFLGYKAGYSNMNGYYNTFTGHSAGFSNASGFYNTFIGNYSGYTNSTGSENTFVGYKAGFSNSTGLYNTFLGNYSGNSCISGSQNVFLGYNAGYNETGSDKLYIDNSNTSSPLIYGDFSANMLGINGWLGVGTQTPAYPMELKTTGRNAAFVANRTDGAINFINATATYGQFGTINNFPVRILVNSIPRMTLNADKSLVMASGATCTVGGVWQNASSRSLKENIVDLKVEEAIETLKGLNPVRFVYKADKSDEQVGFIAEDVPELVATKDRKSMSAMDVVAVLTKVVQEQQKKISLLEARIFNLEKNKTVK